MSGLGELREHTGFRILLIVASALAVAGVVRWVDLVPRVEADFFFAPEDPQLRDSREIAERFPSVPQIIVRAEARDIHSDVYQAAVADLTDALFAVTGVSTVYSTATDRAEVSPLWSRVLLPPGDTATNLVLQIDGVAPETIVPELQSVLAAAEADDFRLQMSGVPVIVELIRSSLFRDLVVFSSGALLLFGLLITIVYRRAWVVVGTLSTCILACSMALTINQVAGLSIGLLTANIVTIVFVLTLSHIVFLTANASTFGDSQAVRVTLPGSFWAMVTTLLGFLSLTLASARPLRELGMAGVIGTVVAMLVAYLVYPHFLGGNGADAGADAGAGSGPDSGTNAGTVAGDPPVPDDPTGVTGSPARPRTTRRPMAWVSAFAFATLVIGSGVPAVDTDPGLLTYFKTGTELRDDLEAIDHDGGSSTLEIVVRDAAGGRLDRDDANERMWAFQEALEADSAVGVVVSPPVLFGHARLQPLARFLSLGLLADILASSALDQVGLGFLSEDRMEGRYFARMHEVDRRDDRDVVIDRLRGYATSFGLDPVLVGGVYDLQGKLGGLIASSLRIGLGGLLALFVVISFVVSGTWRTTALMFGCLVAIPLVVLGTFGHLGLPIDMITSPAANVALALGVDSMIHLVVRRRLLLSAGRTGAWGLARVQMARPILSASFIVCAGFGLFALSTFPPTARFGFAVILGTVVAATVATLVLPTVGERFDDAPAG